MILSWILELQQALLVKLNYDLILDPMHNGRYLEDKGEAREPRDLSQCSGPECLFVSLVCWFLCVCVLTIEPHVGDKQLSGLIFSV